jgi:hypothetical protein
LSNYSVALIKEQGVTFAVVAVKDHVVTNRPQADEVISGFTYRLGCPVVLSAARQSRYYGRTDLVRFLQGVHPSRLPWRQMSWAA